MDAGVALASEPGRAAAQRQHQAAAAAAVTAVRRALVIDTETTGLPARAPGSGGRLCPPRDLQGYAGARVVQVAWVELNGDGRTLARHNYVIRPEGFAVPAEATRIHGISHEAAARDGVPFASAARALRAALARCDLVVAHNLRFDLSVLLSECYRRGLERTAAALLGAPRFDTMLEGRRDRGLAKAPRLVELHALLFGRACRQVHDALDDARIAARCYARLVRDRAGRAFRERGALRPRASIRKPARYRDTMLAGPAQ
jgi:DNA polymerase III epsilon subunit-like protein